MAATTTTSTILAAATEATKKIASETVKKASKHKSSHKNKAESISDSFKIDEKLFSSFMPDTQSITTLLLGLDYIFYLWTFLLIAIVGYLSYCKFNKLKLVKSQQQQSSTNIVEALV